MIIRKRPGEHLKFRMSELIRLYRDRYPRKKEVELLAVIDATVGDPTKYRADAIGALIELKLEERARLNIKTMAAYDATADQCRAYYAERRRAQDCFRKQRSRKKEARVPTDKTRAQRQREKVCAVLKSASKADPDHWLTVEEIAEAVARSKAFAGLKPNSIRKAIHRSLDGLSTEQDTAVGKSHIPIKLIRWKSSGSADTPCPKDNGIAIETEPRPHTHEHQ